MSDYEKPIKDVQDNAIGFRAVNALVESQDAQRQLLELEHDPIPAGPPVVIAGDLGGDSVALNTLDAFTGGAHNTPKVARGTMSLEVQTSPFGGLAAWVTLRFRSGVCVDWIRIQTGVYFIPVRGLTDFYGEALPISADNTTYRECQVQPTSTVTIATATTITVAPGLYVSLWEEAAIDSGNLGFQRADYSFDLVVYGNRDTALGDSRPFFTSSLPGAPRRRWRPKSGVFYVP